MRAIRQLLKPLLPQRGRTFMEWSRTKFGLVPSLWYYARSLLHPLGLARIPLRDFATEHVYIRPGTIDQFVYDEVFLSGEYRLPLPDAESIIDAGGHIGLTATLFALRWPAARIIVIEPDPANYRVLRSNLAHRRNVRTHHGALWGHKTQLALYNDEGSTVGGQVREGSGTEGFTVHELMQLHRIERLDLLKMDIEGAEIEVLAGADQWINQVRALIVELHDRFRPGCRESLLAAARNGSFRIYEQGENTVLVRN